MKLNIDKMNELEEAKPRAVLTEAEQQKVDDLIAAYADGTTYLTEDYDGNISHGLYWINHRIDFEAIEKTKQWTDMLASVAKRKAKRKALLSNVVSTMQVNGNSGIYKAVDTGLVATGVIRNADKFNKKGDNKGHHIYGYRLSNGDLLLSWDLSDNPTIKGDAYEKAYAEPKTLYRFVYDDGSSTEFPRTLYPSEYLTPIPVKAPPAFNSKPLFGRPRFNPTVKNKSNQTVKKEDKTMVAGYVLELGKHGRATSVTIELESGEVVTAATIHHSTVSGWKPGDFAVIQYGGPVFKGVPTLYDGSFKKREVPNREGN